MSLGRPLPVYVTRKTADGYIGYFSLSAWMPLLAILLVWANVTLWGIVGIWKAVEMFV